MKTTNYKVYNIKYDLGDEWSGDSKPDLPRTLIIEDVPADHPEFAHGNLEDYLANAISDKTGFCVEYFHYSPHHEKTYIIKDDRKPDRKGRLD